MPPVDAFAPEDQHRRIASRQLVMTTSRTVFLVICGFLVGTVPAWAVSPELVKSLRQGGYVLVMRHASSPATPPAKMDADPENTGLERQLDEKGRKSAKAMGRITST